MLSNIEKTLRLSKKAAKALYFVEFNGERTSTTQIQDFLSCTRREALKAINELKDVMLVEVFNDRNGTYGDRTIGYKVTSNL